MLAIINTMFIDAHTHSYKTADISFVMDKHSAGIHPWELNVEFTLELIKEKFQRLSFDNVYAVGECGLDRVRLGLMPIADQISIFRWHLEAALLIEKPVVIHCVRAYSDLLQILKQSSNLPKLLIHDFNGNEHQSNELLKYPVIFSVGKQLITKPQLLEQLTVERVLLETDDQFDVTIQDLYAHAGKVFNVDQQKLQTQLEKNFLNLFDEAYDVSATNFIDNFRR